MAKQVTLTIDGRQITVPEGMLVVDAAKMSNITIPVFCYHPKMEPVGMCRQCMVEIGRPLMDRTSGKPILDDKGAPKIQFGPKLETSCTTPVSDGMVVLTSSEKARDSQNAMLEFLLTSHPLDCPICDKGGECPLQNQTMGYGPGKSRFLYDEKMHLAKKFPLGELIVLDQERCIQCGRCIRYQDEIAGDPVLGFDLRGRSMQIISTSDPGFDSGILAVPESVQCGLSPGHAPRSRGSRPVAGGSRAARGKSPSPCSGTHCRRADRRCRPALRRGDHRSAGRTEIG